MTQAWEPGTQYDLGCIVEYEGHRYKIIQPHRSQGDWTPPVTPALWGKMPDIRPQDQYEEKPWHEQHSQQVEIHQEEKEKHWYDIDDGRKKQLEIGGGLAAGVALLAGGYFAYQHHAKKSEEDKKALVWSLQNWLHEAQVNSEDFHRNGPRGKPVTWVLVHGQNIPPGAIPGGEENDQPIYIARAFYEGGVQVGKAGRQFEKGAVIGYGHKEINLDTYEILLGNPDAIKWVNASGHLKLAEPDVQLVEGGREADNVSLFVAQAHHGNGVCPGKASKHLDGAFIPYGGTEERKKEYRVLALR